MYVWFSKQKQPNLEDPSHLTIAMSNVVVSFRVRCHLSLRKIALAGVDVIYQQESQVIYNATNKIAMTVQLLKLVVSACLFLL